jgi:pimeloyl-ACP methyl ester carboxylesterase
MSAITIEGEIIHYEVLGRGRPLIFLHGWIGSWRYWIPAMQAASGTFRAYALDLWGFGDTSKNPSMYSLISQAQLIEAFMENMGMIKIALIGHGLGALVALAFAKKNPTMVDRMMLVGLPVSPGAVNTRLRTAPIADLAEWLLGRLPVTDAARVEAPKADPHAIRTSLDDLQRIDVLSLTMGLATPCLLVHGQNDPAIELISVDVESMLPDQTHQVVFEQSGHFPMLDEANKYNRLLNDFLALTSGVSPRQLQLKEEWKRRVR